MWAHQQKFHLRVFCVSKEASTFERIILFYKLSFIKTAMGTLSDFGQIAMKWDPKNLEIRTMSVEKTLEPLVLQVTTLVNTKGPSKKKKGKKD